MDDGYQWVNPLYNRQSEPIGGKMEAQGTKINQAPELYLAIDLEKMAKGGYKKTIKVSARVFNGDLPHAENIVRRLLESAGQVADEQIAIEEDKDNAPTTTEGITNE